MGTILFITTLSITTAIGR